jgi:hypothetical protein
VRVAALLTVTIAVVVAACGGSSSSDRYRTWAQVAADLRPGLDRESANPCRRGDRSCIDVELVEMHRRVAALSASCDHRALFLDMYTRTTEALRSAVRAGRFHDGPAITHFGAWFADLGFRSEDAWAQGRLATVPPAWHVALTAAAARSVRSLGDVLLGMNAHITRDLAFAVAAVDRGGSATKIDPDFVLFTDVIESKSMGVVDALAQRYDPALALAKVPLALGGEVTLGQVIGVWRTEAWRNGIALRDAHGAARRAVAARIEQLARDRAEAIVAATAYLPVVQSSRSRDAYCAQQAPRFRTRPGGNMGTSDKGG